MSTKYLICLAIFVLSVLLAITLLVKHYILKSKGIIRTPEEKQKEEDEYFKRVSTKHYREDNKLKFDKDYFKKAEEPKKETVQPKQTMQTDDGVIIVQEKAAEGSKRKIFDHDDGEYVEFEEA